MIIKVKTNVAMFSNEKYIFLKFQDKIVIYSIELNISFSLNSLNGNDF
jgi:hypothetical protein